MNWVKKTINLNVWLFFMLYINATPEIMESILFSILLFWIILNLWSKEIDKEGQFLQSKSNQNLF